MNEIKIMRIGSGKEEKDGKRVKKTGYAPKVGKSLSEILKDVKTVKLVSLGDAPGNNALKAIAHAQALLKQQGLDLVATEFGFEDVDLPQADGEPRKGRAMTVLVNLK